MLLKAAAFWTVFYVLMHSASVRAAEVPDGYAWLQVPDSHASVLLPDGWHFSFNQAKLRGSFVIARERSKPGQGVGTGLTVYVVNNMSKTSARPLSDQIQGYVLGLKSRAENSAFNQEPAASGRFKGIKLQYETVENGALKINQRLYLADAQTDELVIATFTVFATDWPEIKSTAEIVLGSLDLP